MKILGTIEEILNSGNEYNLNNRSDRLFWQIHKAKMGCNYYPSIAKKYAQQPILQTAPYYKTTTRIK